MCWVGSSLVVVCRLLSSCVKGSQCTSPKHPVSCIELGLATRSIYPGAAPLGPPRLEAGPCSPRRGQTRPARSRRSSSLLPVPTPSGCLSVPSPLTPPVRLSRKASCLWDLLETAKLVVRVLRGHRCPSSSSWAVITARVNIFYESGSGCKLDVHLSHGS